MERDGRPQIYSTRVSRPPYPRGDRAKSKDMNSTAHQKQSGNGNVSGTWRL